MTVEIKELKKLSSIMNALDVEEFGFFERDGEFFCSGIDGSRTVAILHPIDIVDIPMGVMSVKSMVSRFNLFGEDAKISLSESEQNGSRFCDEIILKEGRKKTTIKTTHPENLTMPSRLPSFNVACSVRMTSEYITHLNSVIASVKNAPGKKETFVKVSFERDNSDELNILISNEFDTFSDVWSVHNSEFTGKSFEMSFSVESFSRVIKAAASFNDEKVVDIDFCSPNIGLAVVKVGMIEAVVSSTTSTER